jgi:GAF domain-containing protein
MDITPHKKQIDHILAKDTPMSTLRQEICDYLQTNIPHYHWVGFYFRDGDLRELKLEEFTGKPTEHTRIPFGKGICGQVAVSNENFIVPDVTAQDNYISCGIEVRSEIVIPLFVHGENIGQIDIDSHDIDPFSDADVKLLEMVCTLVGKRMELDS